MKTILTLIGLLTFSTMFSQVPMSDSKTQLVLQSKNMVKITNLQECAVAYAIKYPINYQYKDTSELVVPGGSLTLTFPICGELRVKPLYNCDGATCGTVGMNTCLFVLGVGAEIKWRQTNGYLEGEITNADPNKKYKAKVTLSGGSVVYYPVELIKKGDSFICKIKL